VSLTHLLTVNKFELEPPVGRISGEMWHRVRIGFDEMLGHWRVGA
jgi:hypothetical protein